MATLWASTVDPDHHQQQRGTREHPEQRRPEAGLRKRFVDALNHYEHVLWMDFDCIRLDEIPAKFWEVLSVGQPLQAKIRQYRRRKCRWRATDQRKTQSGAFIYCRSIPLIERCLNVMAEKRQWCVDDEVSIAYLIDELTGGWKGPEAYKRLGFDPPWYTIRGEIWPAEKPVFTAR